MACHLQLQLQAEEANVYAILHFSLNHFSHVKPIPNSLLAAKGTDTGGVMLFPLEIRSEDKSHHRRLSQQHRLGKAVNSRYVELLYFEGFYIESKNCDVWQFFTEYVSIGRSLSL